MVKRRERMGFIEIILIGLGLSMDAVAVSMANGMAYKNTTKAKTLAMPILFGVFQGLMPLIGYFAGGLFADVISKYANILVFVILGFIGGKMLKDNLGHKDEEEAETEKDVESEGKVLTYKTLFIQAIATSIDAFAVGIGFSAMQVSIIPAVSIIMLTTAICCLIAIFAGKKVSSLLGGKAEILGGLILVIIAVKALF